MQLEMISCRESYFSTCKYICSTLQEYAYNLIIKHIKETAYRWNGHTVPNNRNIPASVSSVTWTKDNNDKHIKLTKVYHIYIFIILNLLLDLQCDQYIWQRLFFSQFHPTETCETWKMHSSVCMHLADYCLQVSSVKI